MTITEGHAVSELVLATANMDAVLCYVQGEVGPWRCYFTTRPLAEQTGDDWDDAPFGCNAGEPYDDDCTIYTIAIYDAWPPGGNWSVDDFNASHVPWLVDCCPPESNTHRVYAGITLRDFVSKCREYGWTVYWPLGAGQ